MTHDEALAVADAALAADGGCIYCVTDVLERVARKVPDHDWPKLVREARRRRRGHGGYNAVTHYTPTEYEDRLREELGRG